MEIRVVADRVRLWPTRRMWGKGCGTGNTPPRITGLKIGDVSPNELPGYEFFKTGNLKGLQLGRSTRDDVVKLFNSDCEQVCNYDSEWELRISYFKKELEFYQTTTSSDGVEFKTEFISKPEFVDRINDVVLSPKQRISFPAIKFSRVFAANRTYSIGDCWDQNGFCGAVHTTSDTYEDGYGLTYSIFNEETFNNLTSDKRSPSKKPQKGDLLYIKYNIPDSFNDYIYDKHVVQAKTK